MYYQHARVRGQRLHLDSACGPALEIARPGQDQANQRWPAGRGSDQTLVPRWVPYLFAGLAVAVAPGIAHVFASAPPLHLAEHWRLAWGGFDTALAGLLAATGLALFRRSPLAEVFAAMTATLLCCDAWLDVLSSSGHGIGAALVPVAEAAFAELPLAALFAWVAVRLARDVAGARPTLRRAGFRIHHRRLLPPAADYPALPDAEPAGSQARWRQWTYQGHTGQPARLPWWLPVACLGSALVLLPWIAWLFVTLPQTELAAHWGLARAGLALALAIVLAASAVALLRRWPVAKVLVAMAAALLIRDAWFNVLTARQGHAAVALAVAAGLELPLAGLCLWVAVSYARAVTVARPYVPRTAQTDRPRGRQTPASGDSSPVTVRT